MGFDGSTNHIISIGVAIDDQPAISFDVTEIADGKESAAIMAFYDYVNQNTDLHIKTFVGHNIVNFDMKIIRHRSLVLGIRLPDFPFFTKPWDLNPYDTMQQWDPKNSIKLDRLARAFGIPGKEGMDGSMVYGAWKEGRIEEIAAYCRADVEMTRAVYKKMTGR
jgi:predicted PolB exonuclease-like 3'-5' exonuclease